MSHYIGTFVLACMVTAGSIIGSSNFVEWMAWRYDRDAR